MRYDETGGSEGPVLEARDLSKSYGEGETLVEALRHANLEIQRGEIVAIMGPSGSGKSTLLSLLGAIETPTSGQVFLEGVDVATLDDTERTLIRRRRLGFIFQAFNLVPILSAVENVALPLELDGLPSVDARQRAEGALAQVGLQKRASHLPGMMSGGEQQRVAIARAIAIEPALILADEPTGNLDSANGEQIMTLLHGLVSENRQTIVMVTHDEEVAATADRVVRLRDGQIEGVEYPSQSVAGSSSP